ncbi:TRAP-type C4-dicarboxylate transport system permease large subunit [Paenibacillus phyllosphaerae]|uniref:TRAP-type C4-dicarboxylate transport system permease large subunit n=1 Tax=Paenibacillus phyllosphaerae TaxID=274593 RepID=A0A7W5AVF5_9BACL|nr:TRAP-type C4-dicarboxylate transport system permease large subunit [Paenibacillus phyllosphaerae]
MEIQLSALHWVYLIFIVFLLGMLIKRRDTTLVCVVGIFTLGLIATESLSVSVSGIFNSFVYAIKELMGTILIISIIVAMSRVLIITGINETMVQPLTRFMRTPALAYWGIGLIMMVTSFFFWPSPAVALIGAVLLPVAVRVGLPALGAAIAMNLFGHGIALSGDYIIQGAPKLTADAAGLPVSAVMQASIPLVIVMGLISTVAAYWFMRRDMKNGTWRDGLVAGAGASGLGTDAKVALPASTRRTLAILIPILFALDVIAMFVLDLQGGDATALVGGTAVLILIAVTLIAHRNRGLEETTAYLIEGFQFGFKVFGPVIPIAAFFYLGDAAFTEMFGKTLPDGSHGIVNDLGVALANHVPLNEAIGAVTLTVTGAITGLDGSGFSGISLAGSVAQLFSSAIGSGADTLTALGQVAAIWVGGGTLIPWALIPAAAICGVSPFELARRNLKPVLIGLAATTVVAMFLI